MVPSRHTLHADLGADYGGRSTSDCQLTFETLMIYSSLSGVRSAASHRRKVRSALSNVLGSFALAMRVYSRDPLATSTIDFGHKAVLHSAILRGDRTLQISVPSEYYLQRTVHPVLYLLDGDETFLELSGLVENRSLSGQIPSMIVVAINNTDRNRDMTPTHSTKWTDGKVTDMFRSSGGGDQFIAFLRSERKLLSVA